MPDLKQRTISGVRWAALTGVIQRLAAFATTVVLARLLDPADFGLYALAFVVIDGFGLFQNLGVDAALIHRREEERLASDTAFWVIPGMGLLLFAGTQLLAPLFAGWLHNDQVVPVVRWLSAIFVAGSLGRVPLALLSKRTDFHKRAWAQMSSELVYAVTAVALALCGWKIWSLVAAYLAKTLTLTACVWILAGWRPSFQFDWRMARHLLRFGGFLTGSSILTFLRHSTGNLLIAKLVDVSTLGFFSIAFGLSNALNTYIFSRFGDVSFPVLAHLQHDRDDLQRAYLKYLKYVTLMALPFGVGLALVAPDLLRVVYGAKWMPAAPLLQVLAVAAMVGALAHPAMAVFSACGRTFWSLLVTLATTGTFLGLVVPCTTRFGAVGTSAVVLVSSAVGVLVSLVGMQRIVQLSWQRVLEALWIPMIGGIVLTGGVLLVRAALPHIATWYASTPLTLALLVIGGTAAYLTYLWFAEERLWVDVRALLKS